MNTCPNCGHEVQPGAAFCPACGENLTRSRVQTQNYANPVPPVKPDDNKLQVFLITILVVLVMIVVGGGVYLITSGMKSNSQPTTTKTKKIVEKSTSNKVTKVNDASDNSTGDNSASDDSTTSGGTIGQSEAMSLLQKAGYGDLDNPALVNSSRSMTTINTFEGDDGDWIKDTYTLYPKGSMVEIHLHSYQGTDKNDPASFQKEIAPTGSAEEKVTR